MHWTKMVLIGDSIVSNMVVSPGFSNLTAGGKTVTSIALAGKTIAEQYATWLACAQRGDTTYDFVFTQVGVNDIIHGNRTSANIKADMLALHNDIVTTMPRAIHLFSTITPCKQDLDTVSQSGGPDRYPLWLQAKADYLSMGAAAIVEPSLNDGADNLRSDYDSGDHLHPNNTGYAAEATAIRAYADRIAMKGQNRFRVSRPTVFQKFFRRYLHP